jgi:hypothetical protein
LRFAQSASSAAEFPANREKCSEFRLFPPIEGKTVAKSPTSLGGSGKIPYAGEQGINSAYQGIKVPCSAENRDIARTPRRLSCGCRARQVKQTNIDF